MGIVLRGRQYFRFQYRVPEFCEEENSDKTYWAPRNPKLRNLDLPLKHGWISGVLDIRNFRGLECLESRVEGFPCRSLAWCRMTPVRGGVSLRRRHGPRAQISGAWRLVFRLLGSGAEEDSMSTALRPLGTPCESKTHATTTSSSSLHKTVDSSPKRSLSATDFSNDRPSRAHFPQLKNSIATSLFP